MHAIFDFSDIKRRALFPANRPQDAGTPVIPAVQQFDEWGMFAGYVPNAETIAALMELEAAAAAPSAKVSDVASSGCVTTVGGGTGAITLTAGLSSVGDQFAMNGQVYTVIETLADTAPSEYLATSDFDPA